MIPGSRPEDLLVEEALGEYENELHEVAAAIRDLPLHIHEEPHGSFAEEGDAVDDMLDDLIDDIVGFSGGLVDRDMVLEELRRLL